MDSAPTQIQEVRTPSLPNPRDTYTYRFYADNKPVLTVCVKCLELDVFAVGASLAHGGDKSKKIKATNPIKAVGKAIAMVRVNRMEAIYHSSKAVRENFSEAISIDGKFLSGNNMAIMDARCLQSVLTELTKVSKSLNPAAHEVYELFLGGQNHIEEILEFEHMYLINI